MSLTYFIGQDVALSASVTTGAGVAIDATSVVLTITAPDLTTTTPATAHQGAVGSGVYTATVPAVAQAGVYLYRWVATATGLSWSSEGQLQVRVSGAELIVDLVGVKAHLNIPTTDTAQDDELQGFILAAEPVIENIVGPIIAKSYTEYFDGGRTSIVVSHQPLIAVQSVTEYLGITAFTLTEQPLGAQSSAFGFTVDLVSGQLTRRTFGGQGNLFAIGMKNIKITYTAGLNAVPWNVRLATLELIRHWFQLTQLGGRPRFSGSAMDYEGSPVPTGFAVPNRVIEMLADNRRPPGIA